MNIQQYISSGIIESCVLGLASVQEVAELESLCAAHPAIQQAKEVFEKTVEDFFTGDPAAQQPHPELKSRIFEQITREADGTGIKQPGAVYPLQPVKAGWWRFIAAASVTLLVGSTILNYYFFNQYRSYSSKYEQLAASQEQLATSNRALQAKLDDYQSALNMMKDPAMLVVKMSSVPSSPQPGSMATVYWDTRSRDVYLLANNLPSPAAQKQYQLWAIVDGKAVDAGMVDLGEGPSFVKMKNIPRAQAFAVTLERKGGSPAPTMSAMYVLGKVTG